MGKGGAARMGCDGLDLLVYRITGPCRNCCRFFYRYFPRRCQWLLVGAELASVGRRRFFVDKVTPAYAFVSCMAASNERIVAGYTTSNDYPVDLGPDRADITWLGSLAALGIQYDALADGVFSIEIYSALLSYSVSVFGKRIR